MTRAIVRLVAGTVELSTQGSAVYAADGRELARLCPQCTASNLIGTLRLHFGAAARVRGRGLHRLDVLVPHELAGAEVEA